MLYSYVADHFQYLACIGPIAIFSAFMTTMSLQLESAEQTRAGVRLGRAAGNFLVCSVLAIMAYLSWTQAHIYDSTTVLWRDTIRKNPLSWMAHNNLGVDLSNQGKSDEAFSEYDEAIKINPQNAITHNNIGFEYAKSKNWAKAEESYKVALRLKPDYPAVYLNLGKMYLELGRFDEARFFLSTVIGKPGDPGTKRNSDAVSRAHYYLGLVALKSGDYENGTSHFLSALRSNSFFPEAHYNLGYALALQYGVGRKHEVIFHYQEALRLNPKYSEAHNNLGAMLFSQGNVAEAADHFRRAVEADSLNMEAYNNYGTALLQLGKTTEAILQFRKALEIKPDYAKARDNLDRALRR
jgi:tetratricopeptide (TPR) repeat protein